MAFVNTNIQKLSALGLMMIAIITVDSIRNLSINAQFGLPLVTLFIFGGIAFFLPMAILTAKLAIRFPKTGGSYLWIQDAFGHRWGFVSIWLQWVYNMLWYPTIFVFIATTLAGVIAPHLETNPTYILLVSLTLFWLITGISCFGIQAVSYVGTFCALLGTLVPMLVMIGLAIFWLASGKPSATPLSWSGLIPNHNTLSNLGFFVNVLFSLMGLDVLGIHAGDVKNPQKNYPRILLSAALIILITMTLSSLALCILLSPKQLGLVNGLIDAAQIFFAYYHISWGVPLMGAAIIIGSFGVASSWIIGLVRVLQVSAAHARMPQYLQKTNRFNMPYMVLLTQAVIVTILFGAYILFPTVNASYWVLSAMSSQLALVYYILLFMAGYKLLKGNTRGPIFALLILGMLTGLLGIIVGFLPPANVTELSGILHYEGTILGCLIVLLLPLYFFLKRKPGP
jgi:glutamate:GABA antiporter